MQLYGCALELSFAVVLAPRLCMGSPLSLEITTERTEAASECADDAQLRGKVEQLSQRALGTIAPESDVIRVHVRFDRTKDEYRADLEFKGPKPGERMLSDHSENCEPLADAAAVAIALLLDTELERRVREAREVQRAVQTIQITRREVTPRPRVARPKALALAIEGGAQSGLNSSVASGFALDLGTRVAPGWLFESSATLTLPVVSDYGPGQVTVLLATVALRACRLWGNEWQLGPCAAMAVGRLHGSGAGYDESFSSNLLWSAIGASVLVQREVAERWDFGLHATAWAPLEKRSFGVQGLGTAWNSSVISGGLTIRLGVRF